MTDLLTFWRYDPGLAAQWGLRLVEVWWMGRPSLAELAAELMGSVWHPSLWTADVRRATRWPAEDAAAACLRWGGTPCCSGGHVGRYRRRREGGWVMVNQVGIDQLMIVAYRHVDGDLDHVFYAYVPEPGLVHSTSVKRLASSMEDHEAAALIIRLWLNNPPYMFWTEPFKMIRYLMPHKVIICRRYTGPSRPHVFYYVREHSLGFSSHRWAATRMPEHEAAAVLLRLLDLEHLGTETWVESAPWAIRNFVDFMRWDWRCRP